MKVSNHIGRRFGRLIVTERAESTPIGHSRWVCQCDCGVVKTVAGTSLVAGATRSCGCLMRETQARAGDILRTHGMRKSKEYSSWQSIKKRCNKPTEPGYARYGARGIKMCARWRDSFEAFFADMGPAPTAGHTVDRINGLGHYEPGNCRWATSYEQSNNRINNRRITFNGKTKTATEWSREVGIRAGTLIQRIFLNNWSAERALTTPPRRVSR